MDIRSQIQRTIDCLEFTNWNISTIRKEQEYRFPLKRGSFTILRLSSFKYITDLLL